MEVTKIEGTDIICQVKNDGKISNHKGVNVPDIHINMPYMSVQDKEDILFGIREDVDYIAASFTRTAEDVKELRKFLDENGGSDIHIITLCICIGSALQIRNHCQFREMTVRVDRRNCGTETSQ